LTGSASTALAYHWLPQVVRGHLDVSLATSCSVSLLVIVWDALRFGIFGYLVAWSGSRHSLLPPLIWVGLEWIWPHVVPWRLGQTQLGCLPFCQIAEVTGVCGVSFLLVWGAAAIAGIWRLHALEKQRRSYLQAVLCALVLIADIAWGSWRMQQLVRDAEQQPQLRIALIQAGACDDQMVARLRDASMALASDVDLAIWGEAAVSEFYSLDLQSFRNGDEVQALTRDEGDQVVPARGLTRPLLFGACSYEASFKHTGPYHNTAFLLNGNQQIVGRYHKRMLMPWGEYAVGQQWLPGLHELMSDVELFAPGDSSEPLHLPGSARLGVLICYEDILGDPARETVSQGADVLININNLQIFGDSAALYEHQQLARFRAIENRRWLVRCGITGSTAVISASGQVTHQARYRAPSTLTAGVPLLNALTFYTRYGDLFAIACGISGLAGLLKWRHVCTPTIALLQGTFSVVISLFRVVQSVPSGVLGSCDDERRTETAYSAARGYRRASVARTCGSARCAGARACC
jgi:apolipoprotein N-acyltransferase